MESVETINQRLLEHYGKFEDGRANWRVVFSDDMTELREVDCTKEGFQLPQPVVMEMKKYPFDHGKYILERLIGIPENTYTDLTTKTSYEPVWTFEDKFHNPLPPDWDVIYLVVNTVMGNIAKGASPFPKYPDTESPEKVLERTEKIYEELYGNETPVGDALKNDSAVGYGTRKRSDWLN